jgi:LVIVD repeat
MKTISYLLLLAVLLGCRVRPEATPDGSPAFTGQGYRPVYLTTAALQDVKTEPPQPLRKPGKIYVRGRFLFINEHGKGLHLINNTDPRAPQKLAFIKIPGNVDIAIKGNYLYADSGRDFVVLDITDPTDVKLIKRIKNTFPAQTYPPVLRTYFECVDGSQGVVVAWEKVSMSRPKCFR